jgi:hypothetical protein
LRKFEKRLRLARESIPTGLHQLNRRPGAEKREKA